MLAAVRKSHNLNEPQLGSRVYTQRKTQQSWKEHCRFVTLNLEKCLQCGLHKLEKVGERYA